MAKISTKKLFVVGNFAELIEYSKPILYDYQSSKVFEDTKAEKSRSRSSNSRTSATLRRLVNANFVAGQSKFITLTFSGVWVDVKEANYEFKKFIQRLKYELGSRFPYVAALEFQSDYYFKTGQKKKDGGNVHYHLICDIPYISIDDITDIWGHGYCWITDVRKVSNLGAYFAKHSKKYDLDEVDKLAGQKKYFTSRGLVRPEAIRDEAYIDDFLTRNAIDVTYEVEQTMPDGIRVRFSSFRIK